MILLLVEDFNKAKYYCKKLISIKNVGLIKIINSYLENQQFNDENLKKFKFILNKRISELTNIFLEGLPYYILYFKNAFKDVSLYTILYSMINGIN